METALIYIFIALIGLAFGSFASVIIHRLHSRQKGILWGRSKCPRCENELGVLDLIPVVSYVINKAKCRFCKKSISSRYPILELSMAGLFLLTTHLVGWSNIAHLVFYLLVTFVFVVLTFYDFWFKEVPDEVSIPAIIFVLIYMAGFKQMTPFSLTLGVGVPVLFFGSLFFGSRGRWIGGGDIRIGALMGGLLGWPMILMGLFLGYLTGAFYSLIGLAIGKFNRRTQIPFVPFLLLGTYITIFWGTKLLTWYQSWI